MDLIAAQDEGFGIHLDVELLDGLFHLPESATSGRVRRGKGGEQGARGGG